MLKFKAQNIPVGVQFQPDGVKKSGMPGYSRFSALSLFAVIPPPM
jgi:hypothetical protein